MPDPKKLVVKDANILIDLECASLFDLWRQLDYETHTTDFVTQQLKDGDHQTALSYIENGDVIEDKFDSDETQAIWELFNEARSGPDVNDCSVLYLAKKIDGMLLTGDSSLRKEAESRNIEVHGTIWMMDQLIETGLLAPKIAADKLHILIHDQGRFLPKKISKERIKKWRKQ